MPGMRPTRHVVRTAIVLAVMLGLSAAAVVTVSHLQAQATASRDSQLKLISLRLDLAQIQQVPWGAAPGEGDSPADVHDELLGDQQQIQHTLNQLSRGGGLPERALAQARTNPAD